ncbi:hypothetical protein VUR80DRAFT_6405 [Thermomyces stellatus]
MVRAASSWWRRTGANDSVPACTEGDVESGPPCLLATGCRIRVAAFHQWTKSASGRAPRCQNSGSGLYVVRASGSLCLSLSRLLRSPHAHDCSYSMSIRKKTEFFKAMGAIEEHTVTDTVSTPSRTAHKKHTQDRVRLYHVCAVIMFAHWPGINPLCCCVRPNGRTVAKSKHSADAHSHWTSGAGRLEVGRRPERLVHLRPRQRCVYVRSRADASRVGSANGWAANQAGKARCETL